MRWVGIGAQSKAEQDEHLRQKFALQEEREKVWSVGLPVCLSARQIEGNTQTHNSQSSDVHGVGLRRTALHAF